MLNAIADPWWGNIVINIIYNDNFFLPQVSFEFYDSLIEYYSCILLAVNCINSKCVT